MACNCHPDHDPRLDYVLGAIENTQAQMTTLMSQAKALAPALHQQLTPYVAPLMKQQANAAKVCKAMGGAYEGAFTEEEQSGIIWLPNPQYARVKIKAGVIGTVLSAMGHPEGVLQVFDKGQGDDGTRYGSGAPLTVRETSFLSNGDLPQGWLFTCTGFEVSVRSTNGSPVTRADMETIGDWRLRYTEEGNTRAVRLPDIRRLPPAHRLELFGDDELVCGQFVGAPFRAQGGPIFRIRGGKKESRKIEVIVDPKLSLNNDVVITFTAVGLEGQRPQVV